VRAGPARGRGANRSRLLHRHGDIRLAAPRGGGRSARNGKRHRCPGGDGGRHDRIDLDQPGYRSAGGAGVAHHGGLSSDGDLNGIVHDVTCVSDHSIDQRRRQSAHAGRVDDNCGSPRRGIFRGVDGVAPGVGIVIQNSALSSAQTSQCENSGIFAHRDDRVCIGECRAVPNHD